MSLELPTIVVCGQQSAGKSSVVEVRDGTAEQHETPAAGPPQHRGRCTQTLHLAAAHQQ